MKDKYVIILLNKIVTGLFDVRVLLAIATVLGGVVTYKTTATSAKVDETAEKQVKTATVDSSWRIENRLFRQNTNHKLDSILTVLKTKK